MVLISGLIGISYGVLNAYGKIFWPSISPLIASTSIIIGLLIYHQRAGEQLTALPLAIASMVGAVGQLIAQLPDLLKCNLRWRLVLKPSPLLIEYLKMLLPACFATLIGTLMTYVDMFFAGNTGTGGWTAVTTSNRLVQLPLGILATAMLVPMLPRFTERAKEQDSEAVKTDYKKALQFMIFLSMPITAVLLCIPEPVTRLLFKRGAFNEDSVHLVAFALVWLAPQIVFYLGRDLITRVYFAYKDTNTPGGVAVVAIAVKAILDWLLVVKLPLGVGGISLASTLITIMNLSLLHLFLRKKIGSLKSSSMAKPLVVITAAGIACGALTFGIYQGWEHYASFALPNSSSFQVERARMVPVKQPTAPLNNSSRQPNEMSKHLPKSPSWFYEPWVAAPAVIGSASTSEDKFESNECLLSMILGVGLSCAAGLAAYLAICVCGRLDEINMLARRLPGMRGRTGNS
jgi:putative peptidoglycan lipid II flippase